MLLLVQAPVLEVMSANSVLSQGSGRGISVWLGPEGVHGPCGAEDENPAGQDLEPEPGSLSL